MMTLFYLVKSDGRVVGPVSKYEQIIPLYELGDHLGYSELHEMVPHGLIRELKSKKK